MIPSWSRQLLVRVVLLASVSLLILGGIWAASGSLNPNQDGPQGQAPSDLPANKGLAEADQAKPAPEAAGTGPGEGKPISLIEAISLLEKAGKGQVVRAERTGDGASVQFTLDIRGKDGAQTQFHVSATGKVILEDAPPTRTASRKKSKETMGKGKERERERERRRDDD